MGDVQLQQQQQRAKYARLDSGLPFLNTTLRDLRKQRLDSRDFLIQYEPSSPALTVPHPLSCGLYEGISDATLMSYCMSNFLS